MSRSKPYTKTLLVIDIALLFLTGGIWLLIMAPREMYRFFGPR